MERKIMEKKKIGKGIEKERKTGWSQNNTCKRRESQTQASNVMIVLCTRVTDRLREREKGE